MYQSLRRVLDMAYAQAAEGKGAERHAGGLPFEEQPMQTISRLLRSERGMAFQAIKKIQEGLNLPTTDRKINELLGAINYLAGIVIYLEAQEPPSDQGRLCIVANDGQFAGSGGGGNGYPKAPSPPPPRNVTGGIVPNAQPPLTPEPNPHS